MNDDLETTPRSVKYDVYYGQKERKLRNNLRRSEEKLEIFGSNCMQRTRRRDDRKEAVDRASRLISRCFFLFDDSYDCKAELTDLETSRRGSARPVPLDTRRTLASAKTILQAPLPNKAIKLQSPFMINQNPPFIPIPYHPRLETSRNHYPSFPIVRRPLEVPYVRKETPKWVKIQASKNSRTSNSMTSLPRIPKNSTRDRDIYWSVGTHFARS